MKITKIAIIPFVLITILVLSFSIITAEAAASYPVGPITIINPYSAGGAGDMEVRALQPLIEKMTGKPLVCTYITTGGGVAAVEKVYNSKADGYTLLYLNNPAAITSELTEDVDFKVMDFTFLQNVSTEYRCVAALKESPINSVKDIIEYSKKKKLSFAHSGIGSSGHLQSLLIEQELGISFNDVPFEGTAAAKSAFLGGHVDLWGIDVVSILPQIESGKVKVIAMCAPKRHARLPDTPTFAELGYPKVEVSTSRGFVGPKDMPKAVTEYLIKVLSDAVNSDNMKAYCNSVGTSLNSLSGEVYKKFTSENYNAIKGVAHLFQ